MLHSPAEIATLSHPSVYVHANQLLEIKILPEITKCSQELRAWSAAQRGCFFHDERPLRYFRYYTERNCDLECESNVSLAACGCVSFFHPREYRLLLLVVACM